MLTNVNKKFTIITCSLRSFAAASSVLNIREEGMIQLATPSIMGLDEAQAIAYAKIPEKIDFVPHEMFSSGSAEEELFGDGAEVVKVTSWALRDRGRNSKAMSNYLSPSQEKLLFLRYNYARFRLSGLIESQKKRFSARRVLEISLWYGRVLSIRSDLANSNLGIVSHCARSAKIEGETFSDLFSLGSLALLRAIDKFDVSLGFKFSSYLWKAISKTFVSLARKKASRKHHFPLDPNVRIGKLVANEARSKQEEITDLRNILDKNLAGLNKLEMAAIREYFVSDQKTLREVGLAHGVTKQGVQNAKSKALKKLRELIVL